MSTTTDPFGSTIHLIFFSFSFILFSPLSLSGHHQHIFMWSKSLSRLFNLFWGGIVSSVKNSFDIQWSHWVLNRIDDEFLHMHTKVTWVFKIHMLSKQENLQFTWLCKLVEIEVRTWATQFSFGKPLKWWPHDGWPMKKKKCPRGKKNNSDSMS